MTILYTKLEVQFLRLEQMTKHLWKMVLLLIVFQRVFNQAKLQIFPIFLFLQQLSSLSSFKRKISEAQFAKEAEMES